MKLFLYSYLLVIIIPANAQEWCKKNKPARLDKRLHTWDNKLISDRFSHSVTPDVVKYGYTQIETAVIFRNEILVNDEWVKDPADYSLNVYNSLMLKHSFGQRTEYQVNYMDVMISGDDPVRRFARNDVNTPVSVGVKYNLYNSGYNPVKLSLYGQLTLPKPKFMLNSFMSPEIRLLFSHMLLRNISITGNIGAAYSNSLQNMTILYAVNPKLYIGEWFELFTEFYKSFTKTGPPRLPCKRGLLGFGFYFRDDIYFYSSFEAGWYNEDSLNSERFDCGLTCRF